MANKAKFTQKDAKYISDIYAILIDATDGKELLDLSDDQANEIREKVAPKQKRTSGAKATPTPRIKLSEAVVKVDRIIEKFRGDYFTIMAIVLEGQDKYVAMLSSTEAGGSRSGYLVRLNEEIAKKLLNFEELTPEEKERIIHERDSMPEEFNFDIKTAMHTRIFPSQMQWCSHLLHLITPPTQPFEQIQRYALPLDKINRQVAFRLTDESVGVPMHIAVESKADHRKNREITTYFVLQFPEELPGLTRAFDEFDQVVYQVVASNYFYGNAVLTTHQIYRDMGGRGTPSQPDLVRIDESMERMRMAHISIDNTDEAKAYKKPLFHKVAEDDFALSFRREQYLVNGKILTAYHLHAEPMLMRYARERKEFTIFTRDQFLITEISNTPENMRLKTYLRERVSWLRNAKRKEQEKRKDQGANASLNYDTIFSDCAILDKKQRQRAKPKIKTIMEHFKQTGVIENYEMGATKVIFWFSN